jgi:hypothetical protein
LLYDIQDQKLKLTSPQGGERYQSPEATVIYFTSLDTINVATAKYSTDAGRTWVDIKERILQRIESLHGLSQRVLIQIHVWLK